MANQVVLPGRVGWDYLIVDSAAYADGTGKVWVNLEDTNELV